MGCLLGSGKNDCWKRERAEAGRNVPSTGHSARLPLARIRRGALFRLETRLGGTDRCSRDTRWEWFAGARAGQAS